MNKRLILFLGVNTALVIFAMSYLIKSPRRRDSGDLFDDTKEKLLWDVPNITYENYNRPIDLANSTALFDSIHAALKQSTSDIHPVGLSFFPAVIPTGTLLFRAGNGRIIQGIEWLAMNAEFSFNFGSNPPVYGRRSMTNYWTRRDASNPPRGQNNELHKSSSVESEGYRYQRSTRY